MLLEKRALTQCALNNVITKRAEMPIKGHTHTYTHTNNCTQHKYRTLALSNRYVDPVSERRGVFHIAVLVEGTTAPLEA